MTFYGLTLHDMYLFRIMFILPQISSKQVPC